MSNATSNWRGFVYTHDVGLYPRRSVNIWMISRPNGHMRKRRRWRSRGAKRKNKALMLVKLQELQAESKKRLEMENTYQGLARELSSLEDFMKKRA